MHHLTWPESPFSFVDFHVSLFCQHSVQIEPKGLNLSPYWLFLED